MAVNVAELERVLGWIQAHPEHHNQKEYAVYSGGELTYDLWLCGDRVTTDAPLCGTAMCFAGTAAWLNGWKFVFFEGFKNSVMCVRDDGKPVTIAQAAEEVLGITTEDASKLFFAFNTLEQLENMVKYLKEYGSLDGFKFRKG